MSEVTGEKVLFGSFTCFFPPLLQMNMNCDLVVTHKGKCAPKLLSQLYVVSSQTWNQQHFVQIAGFETG